MLPRKWWQFSLKKGLVLVALLGACFAWWGHDSFAGSVRVVVGHGGIVTYGDQTVCVSFASWLPPTRDDWVTHYSDASVATDLQATFPHLLNLAERRGHLHVEFSNDAQFHSAKQYLETLPASDWSVEFEIRRHGWSIARIKRKSR